MESDLIHLLSIFRRGEGKERGRAERLIKWKIFVKTILNIANIFHYFFSANSDTEAAEAREKQYGKPFILLMHSIKKKFLVVANHQKVNQVNL